MPALLGAPTEPCHARYWGGLSTCAWAELGEHALCNFAMHGLIGSLVLSNAQNMMLSMMIVRELGGKGTLLTLRKGS